MDERLRFVARSHIRAEHLHPAEVPFCKCTSRSGFQILLEADRVAFTGKLHRDDERPWAVRARVAGRAMVVPFESALDVVRDAHVLFRGIRVTAQDVDDAFFDTVHAQGDTHGSRQSKSRRILETRGPTGNWSCGRSASAAWNPALLRRDNLRVFGGSRGSAGD